MTRIFLTSTIAVAASLAAPHAAYAKDLDLRVDASESAPLFKSATYRRTIARAAANKVASLRPGDSVSLRSFGAVGLDNIASYEVRIGRRSNKASDIARVVAQRIMRMGEGGVRPQRTTEIIAMFQWGRFNCAPGDEIWVATDGIETGMIASPRAVASGRAELPAPKAGYLRNCSVTFVGIGQSASTPLTSTEVNNWIGAWRGYFRTAGAGFTPIVNP